MQKSEVMFLWGTQENNGPNDKHRTVVTSEIRRNVLALAQPLYQENLTVEEICRRLTMETGTTRRQIRRIITWDRAEHIFSLHLSFKPSSDFTRPGAKERIMAPVPPYGKKPRMVKPPSGLPSYLASLYETPLLTPEQEQHLFRQYNYLKWVASEKRNTIDPKNPGIRAVSEIETLYGNAMEVRNNIIQANLRLVVSIARRHAHPNEFFNFVSDGNISLMRAVEGFDYKRGNRFSTYASWAIRNNAKRNFVDGAKNFSRFRTGQDIIMEETADARSTDESQEMRIQAARESAVARLLEGLHDPREQTIIRKRYGLGEENHTLKEVGENLGLTKERVRQLEARAHNNLLKIAKELKILIDDLIGGGAAGTVEPLKPKVKIRVEALTNYFSSLPETSKEHAPDTLPAPQSSSDEEAT